MSIDSQCKRIELLLSDVDGVLTDGRLAFDNQGIETKRFSIRDGLGIKLWQQSGRKFGIITARTSHIVSVRAAELGIDIVRQGFQEKRKEVQQLAEQLGLEADQIAYIGDDLPDLPAIRFAGLGVAVADAAAEVNQAADHVTCAKGGEGAVRELIETILKTQGRWDDAIARYTN